MCVCVCVPTWEGDGRGRKRGRKTLGGRWEVARRDYTGWDRKRSFDSYSLRGKYLAILQFLVLSVSQTWVCFRSLEGLLSWPPPPARVSDWVGLEGGISNRAPGEVLLVWGPHFTLIMSPLVISSIVSDNAHLKMYPLPGMNTFPHETFHEPPQ